MDQSSTIVITGAAGFIGSCFTSFLNQNGYERLLLVDDFDRGDKERNLEGKSFTAKIDREHFFSYLLQEDLQIDYVFHLGARTDTTEFDYEVHRHLNVEYSKKVWTYCSSKTIPLVYASSAATYGAGEFGYDDDHEMIHNLQPLNPYGVSKNEFDKWALAQTERPPFWAGLKFFNVYGPNEYHKGRMASVIFHSFNQIKNNGVVNLFRSHRPDFEDGQQARDFIYVKDVLKVCYWLMKAKPESGIYNLGTGKARSFQDLVNATFKGLNLEPSIRFIDMPQDIRNTYQYFTEAKMNKLRSVGYTSPFYSLEVGVVEYVKDFLNIDKVY